MSSPASWNSGSTGRGEFWVPVTRCSSGTNGPRLVQCRRGPRQVDSDLRPVRRRDWLRDGGRRRRACVERVAELAPQAGSGVRATKRMKPSWSPCHSSSSRPDFSRGKSYSVSDRYAARPTNRSNLSNKTFPGEADDLSVIGAGVGRTGTLTLKLALERLGVGPCYHMKRSSIIISMRMYRCGIARRPANRSIGIGSSRITGRPWTSRLRPSAGNSRSTTRPRK